MDLKLVEHFLLVVDCGSFSRAASVIGMGQPALGRQIEKLEHECGARLLYRHGRGVTLTLEGERFIEGVRPVLRQMELLVGDLGQAKAEASGGVTVGLTPTMLELFGLRLVLAVGAKYPQVKLNVVSGYSGYVHEWLQGGSLDIALVHDARRSKHIDVDYVASAGLHLVSPPGLIEPQSRMADTVDMKDLRSLPLALPTLKHGLRRTLETAAADVGVALDVRYEMDTLSLLKDLVLAGHAHTVLAIPAVGAEVAQGRVVARKLRNPVVETRLMLAIALNRPYTPAMRAVHSEIGQTLREAVAESDLPLDMRFD